ncbi:hypothetical protein [Vagococcus sp.]|uniref:hypothetical protein n=1 Tax=Vagococcus sp. TaxID=1933889 RepID=UPI003F9D467A
MRQLYLQKSVISYTDEHPIVNRSKEAQYSLRASKKGTMNEITIHNQKRQQVATIEVEENFGKRQGIISVEGQKQFFIEQVVTTLSLQEQTELYLVGDWKSLSFDLMKGYRKLAKVRPKWMPFGSSSYEMTIFEEVYEPEIVSLVSAICYFNSKKEKENAQQILQIV